MTAERIRTATQAWADAFAAPMPDGLDALLAQATDDVRFTDPFNDVAGKDGLRAIIEDMVERCREPRFEILDVAASARAGYIRWRLDFIPKGSGKRWSFEGMSEILIAEDGRVAAHIDHWDSGAQLYAKLPVLGWLVGRVRRSLAVTPPLR
jgi:limonene-1,2-epoxide hydrolase